MCGCHLELYPIDPLLMSSSAKAAVARYYFRRCSCPLFPSIWKLRFVRLVTGLLRGLFSKAQEERFVERFERDFFERFERNFSLLVLNFHLYLLLLKLLFNFLLQFLILLLTRWFSPLLFFFLIFSLTFYFSFHF